MKMCGNELIFASGGGQSLDWFRVLENLNSGSEFLLTLKVKSEFGGKNLKKKI